VINLNASHHGRYLTIRTATENGGESRDSTTIDLDDVLKKVNKKTNFYFSFYCFENKLKFSPSWIWNYYQQQ
jgi:hypothetical protein